MDCEAKECNTSEYKLLSVFLVCSLHTQHHTIKAKLFFVSQRKKNKAKD